MLWVDFTEPLKNGAELPTHPALTTARRVTAYGDVFDEASGIRLSGGLHNNEIAMLMAGEQGALSHLYRYAIRNKHLYHTRPLAVVSVETEDVVELLEVKGGDANDNGSIREPVDVAAGAASA